MKTHVFAFFCVTLALEARAAQDHAIPSSQLVARLVVVESHGKDNAIGDRTKRDHAYGALQVRRTVTDDINKRFGTHYRPQDCLGNRKVSVEIFHRYMQMYARKELIGRQPTDEDMARIWNGGPEGWKKPATERYWRKVLMVAVAGT